MRLDIQYRMHFRYSEPVMESQNEVRVRPRDDECQRVLSYRLSSQPEAPVLHASDYWGTAVEHVGVRTRHHELELLAEGSVETEPRPVPAEEPPVAALAEADFQAEHFEMLAPSPHVRWMPEDRVARRAAEATRGASTVGEAVAAVVDDVRSALSYQPGATDIGVELGELLDGGVGVCQDYAHLAIGMMRSVGVPARYVSGYLFAADETAADHADAETTGVVSVQTHAWIEVAVPGWGWWALDPTNGGPVGERHVVIGCGRDYGDVPPVRGAFMGSATADVDAEVVIGRRPADPAQPVQSSQRAPDAAQASVARWAQQQQQQ